MRYNRDTESTARTVEELDAFKGHKPKTVEVSALNSSLIRAGWLSKYFYHFLSN